VSRLADLTKGDRAAPERLQPPGVLGLHPPKRAATGDTRLGDRDCAWDVIGIRAVLHVDPRVETFCPDYGEANLFRSAEHIELWFGDRPARARLAPHP
jgi:hypothetical protein